MGLPRESQLRCGLQRHLLIWRHGVSEARLKIHRRTAPTPLRQLSVLRCWLLSRSLVPGLWHGLLRRHMLLRGPRGMGWRMDSLLNSSRQRRPLSRSSASRRNRPLTYRTQGPVLPRREWGHAGDGDLAVGVLLKGANPWV